MRPRTQSQYARHVARFLDWCRIEGQDWRTVVQLDLLLVTYFTDLFAEGYESNIGAGTLAGICHYRGVVLGNCVGPLPRAARALRGWRQLLPPQMRLPFPLPALGAVVAVLIEAGLAEMGIFLALPCVAYLRPSECWRLTAASLVPPVSASLPHWGLIVHDAYLGVPGKTGIMDESVQLDQSDWLIDPLRALASLRHPSESLWTFALPALRENFYRACLALRIEFLHPHLYCMRHGGASFDLLAQKRPLASIKARGRWACDASLTRYAKATQMQRLTARLPKDVTAYGEYALENLETLLLARARSGSTGLPLPGLDSVARRCKGWPSVTSSTAKPWTL